MAQELIGESLLNSGTGRGRPSSYPWALWINGSVWEVKKGVDFQSTLMSFRTSLRYEARKRGMAVTIRALEEGFKFQFYTPKPEQAGS